MCSSLHQLFLICSMISTIPTSVHMSLQCQENDICSTLLCLPRYSMHKIRNLNMQLKDHIFLFTYLYMCTSYLKKAVSGFQLNLVHQGHNHSHLSLYKTHCQLRCVPCIWNTFQLKWVFNKIQVNNLEKSSTSALFGFTGCNCDSFTSGFFINIYHTQIKDNTSHTVTSHPPGPHSSQLIEKYLH
jgi:hypothetical protein